MFFSQIITMAINTSLSMGKRSERWKLAEVQSEGRSQAACHAPLPVWMALCAGASSFLPLPCTQHRAPPKELADTGHHCGGLARGTKMRTRVWSPPLLSNTQIHDSPASTSYSEK